eukprot:575612-Hanusia_phi.AAC.2
MRSRLLCGFTRHAVARRPSRHSRSRVCPTHALLRPTGSLTSSLSLSFLTTLFPLPPRLSETPSLDSYFPPSSSHDTKLPDVQVKLRLRRIRLPPVAESSQWETRVCIGTRDPVFEQDFQLAVADANEMQLEVTLWDINGDPAESFLGELRILT